MRKPNTPATPPAQRMTEPSNPSPDRRLRGEEEYGMTDANSPSQKGAIANPKTRPPASAELGRDEIRLCLGKG